MCIGLKLMLCIIYSLNVDRSTSTEKVSESASDIIIQEYDSRNTNKYVLLLCGDFEYFICFSVKPYC